MTNSVVLKNRANLSKSWAQVALSAALTALLVLSFQTAPAHAAYAPKATMLQSCQLTPNEPCVESITATDASGHTATGTLTGKTWHGDDSATFRDVTVDEYQFPGFSFKENASGDIAPRLYFSPTGVTNCDWQGNNCGPSNEYLQMVVEPSWFEQNSESDAASLLTLPHRATNLLCGDAGNPSVCHRPLNFDQQIQFAFTLRLPTGFNVNLTTGTTTQFSVKQGTQGQTAGGFDYQTASVQFTTASHAQDLFSPLTADPLSTIAATPYADFATDQSQLILYGSNSNQAKTLGNCANIPSMSVISNSPYQDLPNWDPVARTVNVQLYGPHLMPDGTLNLGYYQAIISGAIAKCLWGIDISSQTQAVISVTDLGDGQDQNVATTVSKFDGNSLIITATNFTFSNPKIGLKLVNPGQSVIATAPAKTVSITCIKGKVKKVVTSKAPKCPSGYKQSK